MRTFRIIAGVLVLILVLSVSNTAGSFSETGGGPGLAQYPPAAPAITVIDLGTPPGKVGSGLIYLIMARAYQPIRGVKELERVLTHMDTKGGADAAIVFDHILAESEVSSLEKSFGLRFFRVDGKVQTVSPVYSVVVPWAQIIPVARLPYVKVVDTSMWPPPAPVMDSTVLATRANLVWPLRDGQQRNITGKGAKIAIYDSGIDIFHPDFFQPDPAEALYDWDDGPGGQTHIFDPGIDTVYIEGSLKKLNFIDADQSGSFDARIDWLYADRVSSGVVGVRDFGPQKGFAEADKSYGERLFIVNKTNQNSTLDWGEQLIALSVSKIFRTKGSDGVDRERSSANNPLILTPRDTQDHGTFVAGIAAAGDWSPTPTTNLRKYVGMAPEPVAGQPGAWDGGLLIYSKYAGNFEQFQSWAQQRGANVMLYEAGEMVERFMDGSHAAETGMTAQANAGVVQVIPAGNAAANPDTGRSKHFVIPSVPLSSANPPFASVSFSVPNPGGYQVTQSVLWRTENPDLGALAYRLTAPGGGAYLDLPPPEYKEVWQWTDWNGYRVGWSRWASDRVTNGKKTGRTDIQIHKADGSSPAPGTWTLGVTSPSLPGLEANGFLKDDISDSTCWYGGIEYTDHLNPSKTVMWPATADKAVVVAAYNDQTGAIAAYSGRGPRIDGTPIVDIAAPGGGSVTGTYRGVDDVTHGRYATWAEGGTSAAAPHVAGAAALMLQADTGPAAGRHDRIEARLKATASTDGFTGDPPEANTWGAGKLNVYSAFAKVEVKLVANSTVPDTSLLPPLDVISGWAATTVKIEAVKNYYTGESIGGPAPIPGGVGSYAATADYSSAGVQMQSVHAVAPFGVTSQITSTRTTLTGSQTGGQPQPPLSVAKLVPGLIGSATQSYQATLSFQRIRSTGGDNYTPEAPYVSTWQRGDARAEGEVNMNDALFIAQYRVGTRGLGETTALVHPVNAASPQRDEKITINDALFIAQYRVNLRDASFNWIALGPQGGSSTGSRSGVASQSTTLEVGSATLPPGGSTQIPVTVKNITDGLGLGAYDVKVAFNPLVIRVDNVLAGSFPNPARKIDNVAGAVAFTAYQPDIPGPMGDVIVAYLAVTAVGGSGTSTPLDLTINTLSNSDGVAIPATDVDGMVTVQ
ncbi:MAG: S8 family serine peptidase [Chloroflexi bacterium]|nr:S8 family serine peptidase [Chloroflexota bacterium]